MFTFRWEVSTTFLSVNNTILCNNLGGKLMAISVLIGMIEFCQCKFYHMSYLAFLWKMWKRNQPSTETAVSIFLHLPLESLSKLCNRDLNYSILVHWSDVDPAPIVPGSLRFRRLLILINSLYKKKTYVLFQRLIVSSLRFLYAPDNGQWLIL